MNLEQLRTFREVAIQGGFGRAARSLYLTQSAVSMQIAALEQELGVRLFERLGRRISLTHAGQVFLRYATHVSIVLEESIQAMAEIRGADAGSLAVGATPSIANYYIPAILGRFKTQHPGIQLALEIGPTPRIAERLVAGTVDVGLVEESVSAPELVQRPFLVDELVLVVPPGHRWVGRSVVAPQELATEPFIVREPGSSVRQMVEERLRERGVQLRPILEISSPEAIKAAVQAGLGVAIVSAQTARLELSAGALHAIPLQEVRLERQFQVVLHHDKHISAALSAFLGMV